MFTFVRHPYQRALSAYFSKIIDDENLVYFRLRDYLTCNYDLDITAPENPENFHKFLQFLLNQHLTNNLTDVHFLPQTDTIDFANTTFDFIGKVETFNQDLISLINLIESKLDTRLYKSNVINLTLNPSTKNKFDNIDYFGSAAKKILQTIYKSDFEILGFDP